MSFRGNNRFGGNGGRTGFGGGGAGGNTRNGFAGNSSKPSFRGRNGIGGGNAGENDFGSADRRGGNDHRASGPPAGNNMKGKQPGGGLTKPQWDLQNLSLLTKNFYIPHFSIANRSHNEVDSYRTDNEITVKGNNTPKPIQFFEESNFPDYILEELRKSGFAKPTSIQAQGWAHNLLIDLANCPIFLKEKEINTPSNSYSAF